MLLLQIPHFSSFCLGEEERRRSAPHAHAFRVCRKRIRETAPHIHFYTLLEKCDSSIQNSLTWRLIGMQERQWMPKLCISTSVIKIGEDYYFYLQTIGCRISLGAYFFFKCLPCIASCERKHSPSGLRMVTLKGLNLIILGIIEAQFEKVQGDVCVGEPWPRDVKRLQFANAKALEKASSPHNGFLGVFLSTACRDKP